ncbi:alfin-like 6 [Arabidopsis thaliana]|uniref:PHD finger protein ALFIN-LIKE n=1 Tax=Arabidopsis thaliana TaxID=3702 RepID=A0A1P8AYM4_ARATH|nr:alfin-like 6 [Arabidopsis thaliana]ANM61723.1 alfin-like 6 [Arabidopsis thaliana]|eukprot:NP_001323925.1 alfin-like 6 [Arabidopsis thaliana]
MEGITHPIPRTVEEVFSDFRGRRAGLIKALTNDMVKFYQTCDPEKENLCLYGLPNETWEVNLPVEEVPPELPEPALGINFARDGMQEKDWVSLVAVHSDSWLLSVAFYFGARFGFGKNERKRLFQMINELPTIFEVVSGNAKQSKDLSVNNNNSKSKPSGVKVSLLFHHFVLSISAKFYLFVFLTNSLANPNLSQRLQRCHLHRQKKKKKKKMRVKMRVKTMNKVRFVVLVETTTVQMSSGFAATRVRNGSMENV